MILHSVCTIFAQKSYNEEKYETDSLYFHGYPVSYRIGLNTKKSGDLR